MRFAKKTHFIVMLLLIFFYFPSAAQQNDFYVNVSVGPFAKKSRLTEQQENFSLWWKTRIEEELDKPVNFAGNYRLFVSKGGHGKECIHDYWICGWVIDKSTGKVVSTLPMSPEGGDSYAEAVDNGTIEGVKFNYVAKENSTTLIIRGRAVNAPLRDEHGFFYVPKCRLIKYKFNGVNFDLIKEDENGCNLPEEKEIYGE